VILLLALSLKYRIPQIQLGLLYTLAYTLNFTTKEMISIFPVYGVLTSLSTIFQLYRGGQFLLVEETGVLGENH
jgi:hypothetical protein